MMRTPGTPTNAGEAAGETASKTKINTPMKYIISANYRNRSSAFKWLVREENQEPEAAKAYKTVTAECVEFTASSAREEGYGCKMVAIAESVTLGEQESEEQAQAPEIHNPDSLSPEEVGEGFELVSTDYVTKEGDGHEWYSAWGEWVRGIEFGDEVTEQYELDSVRIPKKKAEHNPSNLTLEQLGEGWEFAEPDKPMPEGYQYWEYNAWLNGYNNTSTPEQVNPTRSVRVPIKVKKAEPVLERIRFTGSRFVWDSGDETITKLAALQLNADGTMEGLA